MLNEHCPIDCCRVVMNEMTYIYFDGEYLALLLQARRTVGRYQTLGNCRQKLVAFTRHIPSSLNNLAARRPQVRT